MFKAQQMTRRAFLRRTGAAGGVVVLGGVLSACSGDQTSSGNPSGSASDSADDVKARLAAATGSIRTLMWEGYEDPAAFKPIADRIKIDAAFMAANEDEINKAGTYEIGCGINGIYPALYAAGVMQPIDVNMIPNLESVFASDTFFTSFNTPQFTVFDNQPYGMPYVWASQGVSYMVDEVPVPPTSIEDFLDPAYAGKLGIGDDGNSVIIQVARLLGFGGDRPAFLTQEEFDAVFHKLEEFKAQTKGIIANPYGEYASAYGRGEIIAAFPDWAPTTVAAKDGGANVEMSFTPESFTWIDTLFIASDMEPTDAMYAFLNHAIDPATQFQVGNDLILAVVNADAQQRLVEQGGGWAPYADLEQLSGNAPVVEWPPVKADGYVPYSDWLRRWEEFKAS
ncbi:MAG: ABC transporter substrate-binding protein [Actinomycetota bacterium]